MASVIYFLDSKGKPLLSRDYKGDIPSSSIEKFPLLLLESEEENSAAPPVFNYQGINYLYLVHNDLYLLALTKKNEDVLQIMLFLNRIIEVLTQYFKHLEEESIRDNFVVIYELLDEMMDFGRPQTTDTKILKEYITQESHALVKSFKNSINNINVRPPNAVTNSVSWRQEGIMYKKNEVFLDVIESINMLINSNGQVLRSEILGKVKIKSNLSGMPDLRLGLNDKGMFGGNPSTSVPNSNTLTSNALPSSNGITNTTTATTNRQKGLEMEDIKFHQCVRLSKFENERIITFIPPDGEFDLMTYRLSTPIKPLIWVDCKIFIHSNSRIEIKAKAKAQIKKRSIANNVEIIIPVPEDADSPKFKTSSGSIKYTPENSCIVWKIKQFNGGKEAAMISELGLPSVDNEEPLFKNKRPIQIKFQIPYFITTGLQVRYLRINEPKMQYQSYPWVRYITQSGDDYTIRINQTMT
ncbi:Apm1p [Ascoidea rubescens DSM 1968]|uniref:Clathrin adaptor, mu subunit n=1 Tax=Ascoidea rubescens DSM 1968 TaxID=1344418 RepID=A0A1D2VHK4_9ASCO|nr:clathrin adaptor, mu subunit [Ascoidea rubescens DSM 1968]ODV61105.1 clathrin adaptor, mu subunit [Ascoidea rubescens DSM 1968]